MAFHAAPLSSGNNCPICALLDTGSMVSTIAERFVPKLKFYVKPFGDLIRVEGAGGHSIQYSGYVE